jgi:hypothetical protein
VSEYWFARYRTSTLVQNQSRGLVPIGWKGRATIAAFGLGMVLGGLLFLFFGLRDQFQIGIPIFVIFAIASFSFFLWAAVAKSDPVKTIYDYRPQMKRPPADQKTGV